MGSEGKYWTAREIYRIEMENMGPSGEYWTTWGNIGQRGEILDNVRKYSIVTEINWIETGNMRQRREIRVGNGK